MVRNTDLDVGDETHSNTQQRTSAMATDYKQHSDSPADSNHLVRVAPPYWKKCLLNK